MTEREAAGETALADTPRVSIVALEVVRALLDRAPQPGKADPR
jgi:hypothetical protein